jgi:hypothetical protein
MMPISIGRCLQTFFVLLALAWSPKTLAQDPRSFTDHEQRVQSFLNLLDSVDVKNGEPVPSAEWRLLSELGFDGFITPDVWRSIYKRVWQLNENKDITSPNFDRENDRLNTRVQLLHSYATTREEILNIIPADRDPAEVQKAFQMLVARNIKNFSEAKKAIVIREYYLPRHLLNLPAEMTVPVFTAVGNNDILKREVWSKLTTELGVIANVNPDVFDRYLMQISSYAEVASDEFTRFVVDTYRNPPATLKGTSLTTMQSLRVFLANRTAVRAGLVPSVIGIASERGLDANSRHYVVYHLLHENDHPREFSAGLVDAAIQIIRHQYTAEPDGYNFSNDTARGAAYTYLIEHFLKLTPEQQKAVQQRILVEKPLARRQALERMTSAIFKSDGNKVTGFDSNYWNSISDQELRNELRSRVNKEAAAYMIGSFVYMGPGLSIGTRVSNIVNSAKACFRVYSR